MKKTLAVLTAVIALGAAAAAGTYTSYSHAASAHVVRLAGNSWDGVTPQPSGNSWD